ncbi:MAG: GGDEF domain-containing protein [Acidovorax sp.]|uniref:GGDEF domain-containing protein n=1 Tax=Acidovorax sp. TaxID=1872122 RepID=UPI0039E6BF52
MPLSLDVPTMLLMTAAASLAMAGALAAVRPERREGIGLWALGLVLHTITYVLFTLRGKVPDWASIVLANMLLSCTFALVLAAVHQFQGRALPWWRMLVPVVVMTVLYAVYIDDYRMRLMIAGVVPPVQLGLALWSLWVGPHRPAQRRGAAMFSAGLALQVLLLGVRGVAAATYAIPVEGLMHGNLTQSFTFMAAFMVVIFSSLGFILMTKDRADADNRYFAGHDAVTGVANRRALLLALDRDVARAVRTGEWYSLLMLDIDHFKDVNDTHGHRAGDRVLGHVAATLCARLRAQDLVGRYGGEEFLVLLPGTPLDGAVELADALRAAVAQTPCMHEGHAIPVTVSVGASGARLAPGAHWDPLLQAADQALYAAKSAGRNRVEATAPK